MKKLLRKLKVFFQKLKAFPMALVALLLTSLLNITPLFITVALALLEHQNVSAVFFDDFVKSGDLAWISFAFAGVVFLETLFENKLNLDKPYTRGIVAIELAITIITLAFYIPIKSAYLEYSEAIDCEYLITASLFVLVSSGIAFLTYLITKYWVEIKINNERENEK